MGENFYAKKSLGQNFLKSKEIAAKIVDTALISTSDIVLEAGPGKGILTAELLAVAREVIAVELDPRLVMYLKLKFSKEIESGKLKLIEGDILEFDPGSQNLQKGGYKLVANLPYYITGKFLRRFLSETTQPSMMVLMLQQEVAKRIVGRGGKESMLSISVKVFSKPSIAFNVPRGAFSPAPSIDSSIILIDEIDDKRLGQKNTREILFQIIKQAFGHKRKQLAGNLAPLYGSKENAEKALVKASIAPTGRAEDISISQWIKMAKSSTLEKGEFPVTEQESSDHT